MHLLGAFRSRIRLKAGQQLVEGGTIVLGGGGLAGGRPEPGEPESVDGDQKAAGRQGAVDEPLAMCSRQRVEQAIPPLGDLLGGQRTTPGDQVGHGAVLGEGVHQRHRRTPGSGLDPAVDELDERHDAGVVEPTEESGLLPELAFDPGQVVTAVMWCRQLDGDLLATGETSGSIDHGVGPLADLFVEYVI